MSALAMPLTATETGTMLVKLTELASASNWIMQMVSFEESFCSQRTVNSNVESSNFRSVIPGVGDWKRNWFDPNAAIVRTASKWEWKVISTVSAGFAEISPETTNENISPRLTMFELTATESILINELGFPMRTTNDNRNAKHLFNCCCRAAIVCRLYQWRFISTNINSSFGARRVKECWANCDVSVLLSIRYQMMRRMWCRPFVFLKCYLAMPKLRRSRMTVTLICPGYSISDSILFAISWARVSAIRSSTRSGSTMTRISRPAWIA